MKKIYIDAGHNHAGKDTGATGNGLLEQDITVQVAKKLEKILNNFGIKTKCSRNSISESIGYTLNESLTGRYNGANNWGADLFVSLHCDAAESTAKGSHICIYGKGGEAEKMAKAINPYLLELGLTGRAEVIQVRTDLSVLKRTNMPAILIEMGFITNKRDSDIQRDNQDGLADAIAHGLCDYLGINYKREPAKDTNTVQELSSVNDIVWELEHRGIITNKDLWLKKLEEDTNAYWLAKKTVNYLIKLS